MTDQRTSRLAQLLIEYSMKVEPGERIAVTGTTLAEPLMLECMRQILRAGAHPHLVTFLPGEEYILFSEASDEQLAYI